MLVKAFRLEIWSETESMNAWSVGERKIVCSTENYTTTKPAGNSVMSAHLLLHLLFCSNVPKGNM